MHTYRTQRVTLAEMLGILAVLVTLISVLCPIIARARSTNRGSHLLSDTHQVGRALAAYTQDYDGVPSVTSRTLNGYLSSNRRTAARLTALLADPPGSCTTNDSAFTTANGGCKDLITGKVWSADRYLLIYDYSTQSAAQSYCSNLVEGGYSNWRLPTKDEISTLALHGGQNHLSLDVSSYKWSSTKKGNKYWIVETETGTGFLTLPGSIMDAICVRP